MALTKARLLKHDFPFHGTKTGTRVQKRNDGTKNRNEGTFAKTARLQNRPCWQTNRTDENMTSEPRPLGHFRGRLRGTFRGSFRRSP